MTTHKVHDADVAVIGSGLAAAIQLRHLRRALPEARLVQVGSVDTTPRAEDWHFLVEIASLFFTLDQGLGLGGYLVERHVPASGIQFHWPRGEDRTGTLADYDRVLANREMPVQMWLVDHDRLVADLTAMNRKTDIPRIDGRVVGLRLPRGDAPGRVTVRDGDDDEVAIRARFLIGADGRGGLMACHAAVGGAMDQPPAHPRAGRAVLTVDRVAPEALMDGLPGGLATVSVYHALHYFYGPGYCVSVAPTGRRGRVVVSLLHHHEVVPADQLDTPERFNDFLAGRHGPVARLIASGHARQFTYLDQVTHSASRFVSPDGWAVVGDAAYDADLNYAANGTTLAFTACAATEAAAAVLSGDRDAGERCEAFNGFIRAYRDSSLAIVKGLERHAHDARVMSHRVFFEWMFWFGVHLPMFVGKWFLVPRFARGYASGVSRHTRLTLPAVYRDLARAAESGRELPVLDCYRADQLFGGFTTTRAHTLYLENAELEPRRCDVFRGMQWTHALLAAWYLILRARAFGPLHLAGPREWHVLANLLAESVRAWASSLVLRGRRMAAALAPSIRSQG
jgi:2-polyprenyl-6-methoxyphenol hydroxylase-like FAD-dependent oxidoreductase